ncbi:MAG: hypothetical protein EOP88_07710 [Verrucomicrobiaceae bacterium]|nr:MAG: hypothetical protein EOP88_07710 [Verrucomicrobiaceae bacterium]
MTARCYRSRSFWFGLAGLVILLCGWIGFLKWTVNVSYSTSWMTVSVGKDFSSVRLVFCDIRGPSYPGHAPAPGLQVDPPHENDVPFMESFGAAFDYGSFFPGHGIIHIAIWLIVAIYTVLWLAWVVWCLRRTSAGELPLAGDSTGFAGSGED